MTSAKKSNAYRGLIIWMIVLLVLAALACGGYVYTSRYLERRAQENADEVKRINDARTEEYNAALNNQKVQAQAVSQKDNEWPVPQSQGWDVVDLTGYPISAGPEQSVTRNDMLQGGMLIINRWHAMPADLTDDMMVSISRKSREDNDRITNIPTENASVLLMPDAVHALMNMYQDARNQGLDMDNIIVGEGYRTMETQSLNWQKEADKYSARYSGDKLTERVINAGVAYPGTSDYQSGMSVFLYNYKSGDKEFSNTPLHDTLQGKWIYTNCWKYGFVFRFPVQGFPYEDTVDKSYITGISTKIKAYRYAGIANATAMHALDMCMEEYAEYLMKHPHIAVYEDGVLRCEIYRLEGGYSDTTVTVPAGCTDYTVSTDNLGGMIVAARF